MSIYLSAAVALAGCLIYAFATKPELQTMGLVAFGSGLLAFLLTFHSTLHLP